MEKKKCPEVRFKGFIESWEQQTLGDMFIPLSNNTLSRADLNYENGQIKNIHYGDILVKYAAVLDSRNDKIPFITDGEISDFKSQRLQNGDVIFADTAEDETVGKAIEIHVPADTFIVSGLHTMAYRPKTKLSSFYLGHYLNSNLYHYQLLPLMQGIKVLSISRTNLAKTLVRYPSLEQEQTQIGNFFQNLDQSIAFQEKKLTQTQNIKKAMLEKMFPKAGSTQPEIRLKGFSGEWEAINLGSLCQIGDIDHRMPESTKSGIPYLMTGDFFGINGLDFENAKLISNEDYEQLSKKIKPEIGDILFARYASVGTVRLVVTDIKFLISYSCAILKTSVNSNGEYLFYWFQTSFSQNQIEQEINTGSQRNIGIDSLKKLSISLPKENEQKAIAKFFKQFDETLVLQQQQLQTLKNLKQAFLEKMFV